MAKVPSQDHERWTVYPIHDDQDVLSLTMAELAALEGGVGLASSIITFIEFSLEFGKLVRQLAQTQGGLPKELEECRDYINVVAAWLNNIERSIPAAPHAEEDLLLGQAIERCQNTSGMLMTLLQTLSGTMDENQTAYRARTALRHAKRAGQIMWRRDDIAGIRDKLKAHRDDVQLHLGSRIGHHVKKVMDQQNQIGGSIQHLKEEVGQVILRLDELEAQQKYLIMQNHDLTMKFDILFKSINQERMNIFALAIDYWPSTTLAISAWKRMLATTAVLFTPTFIYEYRQPDDLSRILAQQSGRQTLVADETFTIQVIISPRGSSFAKQPLPIQYKREDTFRFTITDALLRLNSTPERLPALKSTCRVMVFRLQQKDENLSISDSLDLQTWTARYYKSEFPVRFRFRVGTQLSGQPGWPLLENFNMVRLHYLPEFNSLYTIDSEAGLPVKPLEAHEAQWGIYIERDWSSTAKLFVQHCAFATFCQLVSPLLTKYGGYIPPQEVLFFTLALTALPYILFREIYWYTVLISQINGQEWRPALLVREIQQRFRKFSPRQIRVISGGSIFVFWLLLLDWVLENYVFGLKDIIRLIVVISLYAMVVVFSMTLAIALIFGRNILTRTTRMVRKFLNELTVTCIEPFFDNQLREISLSVISLFLLYDMALSIRKRIIQTKPAYLLLAPSFGSIFIIVYLCHLTLVLVDGTLISQLLQGSYMLVLLLVLSIDDTATAWILCLGNFIAYCITGLWIGRRWMKRRRMNLQSKRKQSV